MPRLAKVFMNNGSQAVRLPKEFQLKAREVFIRKSGGDIVISPRPADWSAYFEEGPLASRDFMSEVDDLPLQERKG